MGELVDIPELVAVFPLPNVVLFPGSAVPLHVFEPRYRAMVADALLGERVLALALLKPGYEPLYHTLRAPIHAVVGLGRIVDSASIDDGTYNIVLRGEARATVREEFAGRPYRFARIDVVAPPAVEGDSADEGLRADLCAAIEKHLGETEESKRRWKRLAGSRATLSELADLVAAGLPVAAEVRQSLLAEPDARRRTEVILEALRVLGAPPRGRRGYPMSERPHQN